LERALEMQGYSGIKFLYVLRKPNN